MGSLGRAALPPLARRVCPISSSKGGAAVGGDDDVGRGGGNLPHFVGFQGVLLAFRVAFAIAGTQIWEEREREREGEKEGKRPQRERLPSCPPQDVPQKRWPPSLAVPTPENRTKLPNSVE